MSYTYQVLTEEQIRLLNDYAPWANKVSFAQLMDECLKGAVNGEYDTDISVGQDANVTRDVTVGRRLYVGGGYGTTGVTIDENGNLTSDGVGDFKVGSIIAKKQTPATAGATGTTGTIVWDDNYIYVCIATNTWKRASISGGW